MVSELNSRIILREAREAENERKDAGGKNAEIVTHGGHVER